MLSAVSQLVVTQPAALAAAAGIALLIAAVAFQRRVAASSTSLALAACGAVALCLAAGDVRWIRDGDEAGSIFVMVDHSASTRGAEWRDPLRLQARAKQLLGERPFEMMTFGDEGAPLTVFSPPAGASAILLFSDGRFEPPDFSPRIFPVMDPSLDNPPDAAVTDIEWRDRQIVVSLRNTDQRRKLTLSHNGSDGPPQDAPQGAYVVAHSLDADRGRVVATLSTGDRWPENDSLSMDIPIPERTQRWWVSDAPPPPNWRHVPPAQLPTDAGDYLSAAVIALVNVPADAIPHVQQRRLSQYVQELGGGLMIVGGDRAFAAGGYAGSALEALSPLSSTSPDPQRRWILLADASGSMAQSLDGGATRWSFAVDALRLTASSLPPADSLRIGHFAGELHWWTHDASSDEISIPSIAPSGPTRLEPALRAILSEPDALPTELIVLTDAEAEIADVSALADQLTQQRIRLHLLATQSPASGNPVVRLARQSGGAAVAQADPRLWFADLRDLTRGATPDSIMRQTIEVRFLEELSAWPQRNIEQWNRAWLKSGAKLLASAPYLGQSVPMLGIWNAGTGKVIAAAYPAGADDVQSLSTMVAAAPSDPRFIVRWDAQSVRLDAMERQVPINGLAVSCRINERVQIVVQTAPGRYELRFDRPRAPSIAELMVDASVVSRLSLAAGYAREFDVVGNDRQALQSLADRSGGRVIPPDDRAPIDLESDSVSGIRLAPWLAGLGALFIATALLIWKWMG